MSKKLSLSVVVPVYNEAACMAACLDHLVYQGDDINEIVFVDNY
ncbi:MAG: glycosyltransferase [Candidatus Saccharimonadales bacterium]